MSATCRPGWELFSWFAHMLSALCVALSLTTCSPPIIAQGGKVEKHRIVRSRAHRRSRTISRRPDSPSRESGMLPHTVGSVRSVGNVEGSKALPNQGGETPFEQRWAVTQAVSHSFSVEQLQRFVPQPVVTYRADELNPQDLEAFARVEADETMRKERLLYVLIGFASASFLFVGWGFFLSSRRLVRRNHVWHYRPSSWWELKAISYLRSTASRFTSRNKTSPVS